MFNYLSFGPVILSAHNKLEDSILEIFAFRGNLNVKETIILLKHKGYTATEQGVYRVLRKLQKDGIIVKTKNYYNIRLAWLMELSDFIKQMEKTYLHERYLDQFLPEEKEKYVWHFSDLHKMNDFWSQILIALSKHSKKRIVLGYSPHLWYLIGQKKQESQFTESYMTNLKKSYFIVGGRTYLDKYCLNNLDKQSGKEHQYLASESEYIEKKRSLYMDVVDDYVLCTTLDNETTQIIEKIFEDSNTLKTIDELTIQKLWKRKIKGKIILKKDSKKARHYYKKFEKIFGPLE